MGRSFASPHESKLEKREGRGETEPFTGTAIIFLMGIVYCDEVLSEERSYIDGKLDGNSIQYDRETGRKIFETVYKNGKRHLEQKEFYENRCG